jgi:hypothetical protein
MRLKVGDRAQIEPPQHIAADRLPTKVVGWVENESLIMTVPQTRGGPLELREGETVVVRVFTGRQAFAFRSVVLKKSAPPFRYLHLSFPERVEGAEVRSSPRYRVDLPGNATAAAGGNPVGVRIDNIGTTGALVIASTPLGVNGELIKLEFSLVLHDIPVSLSLKAKIRSTQSDEDGSGASRHRHGVSFEEPGTNDRLILAALVCFNMYENPKQAA